MSIRRYLPSATFATMVGALALSGGLVLAAQAVSHRDNTARLSATADTYADNGWQRALEDVQAQSDTKALTPVDSDTIQSFLRAAQSQNLTDTIGRTLFINLSDAKSQGLGDDTPTQERLVAMAAAQVGAATSSAYTIDDLSVVDPSAAALHRYGNAVMNTLLSHPEADARRTYMALGAASDSGNGSPLEALGPIGTAYGAIAEDLAALPVPSTLSPLHLQLSNDFAAMAATYPNMQTMHSDPLRALSAVQTYASLLDETSRVLTNIAQILRKDGILFNKDEPGTSWSALLSS